MSLRVSAYLMLVFGAGLAAVPGLSRVAHADATTVDNVRPADDSEKRHIDRSWLYVDDANVAAPGTVIGSTSASYTSIGSNPDRVAAPYKPFAFNTAQPGALMSLGAEAGIFPRVSVLALGQMALGGEGGNLGAGAVAGVRVQLLPSSWRGVRLMASAGYLREAWTPTEARGDNGMWGEATIAGDIQRLRLGMTAHGEHVFADGRDGVDLMFRAGASYRVVGAFRAGVEWVGQDLEEAFQDAAEGGARQFIGPTASVQLLHDRMTVVAGPSIGLSDRSPQLLGRFALSYGF
jgi:hypothetical protein